MRERGVTDVRQGTLADVTDWATSTRFFC
jgi:hypothetical protein